MFFCFIDDESKKTKPKVGKIKKKDVKPKVTLEKTTPSAFFGSSKPNNSTKNAAKRKASENVTLEPKLSKKVNCYFIIPLFSEICVSIFTNPSYRRTVLPKYYCECDSLYLRIFSLDNIRCTSCMN